MTQCKATAYQKDKTKPSRDYFYRRGPNNNLGRRDPSGSYDRQAVPFPSGAMPDKKEMWKEKGNAHIQEYVHNMRQVPSIEVLTSTFSINI
jgi:hypothetical protein